MVLAPKLGAFARAYPDVVLDVTTTNEMRLDLVARHFDAGIHLGEFIEREALIDMLRLDAIAVRDRPSRRFLKLAGSARHVVNRLDQAAGLDGLGQVLLKSDGQRFLAIGNAGIRGHRDGRD